MLTRRFLLPWYSSCLAIGLIASALAWRSHAWQFFRAHGFRVDATRLAVSLSLSVFTLWCMSLVPKRRQAPEERGELTTPISPLELGILGGLFGAVLISAFFFQLPAFHDWLKAHSYPLHRSSAVASPYFVYVFYEAACWIGGGGIVLLAIRRAASVDHRRWKAARNGFQANMPEVAERITGPVLQQGAVHFQNYTVRLKAMAERYIPVVLTVGLALEFEGLAPIGEARLPVSLFVGKFALWLILGPTVAILCVLVSFGYQGATQRAERFFRSSLAISPDETTTASLLRARDDLLWSRSTGSFLFTTVKSAGVTVPLLIAISTYVLRRWHPGQDLVTLFVPKELLDKIVAFLAGKGP